MQRGLEPAAILAMQRQIGSPRLPNSSYVDAAATYVNASITGVDGIVLIDRLYRCAEPCRTHAAMVSIRHLRSLLHDLQVKRTISTLNARTAARTGRARSALMRNHRVRLRHTGSRQNYIPVLPASPPRVQRSRWDFPAPECRIEETRRRWLLAKKRGEADIFLDHLAALWTLQRIELDSNI